MDFLKYTHSLIRNLTKMYPEHVKKMRVSDHNSETAGWFSEWHVEGSVWTHTMMVLSHVLKYEPLSKEYERKHQLLIIAALLHDLGKPDSRVVNFEKSKIQFIGHSGVSTFLAREVIQVIDESITNHEMLFILKLINYHQILYDINNNKNEKTLKNYVKKFANSHDFLYYLELLRDSDNSGSISDGERDYDTEYIREFMNLVSKEPGGVPETHKTMTLLIGLPCSGKSTFSASKNEKILSRDDILMSKTNLSYNEAFSVVDQAEVDKEFEDEFRKLLQREDNFIIDRTNLTHKGRMKFVTRAREFGFGIKYIVFMPEFSEVQRRNQERIGKVISKDVYLGMMKSFQMPFDNEYDEIHYRWS